MEISETESGQVQIELNRIFGIQTVRVFRVESLEMLPHSDCVSVLVTPRVSGKQLVHVLQRIENTSMGNCLIVGTDDDFIGHEPVPVEFGHIREALIQDRLKNAQVGVGESAWLSQTVAEMLGKETLSGQEMDATLEHLGIDSLGRLQLWHSFKRKFPNSRMSQISPNVPLRMIVGHVDTEETRTAQTWLALHGFRTNPLIMEHQVGSVLKDLVNGGAVDVVYAQAPHAARGPCPQGIQDGFEWWYTDGSQSYEDGWRGSLGVDESLEYLRKLCADKKFDGVVGFSQGAGMAHALLTEGVVTRGILFSPVSPLINQWPIHANVSNQNSVIIIRDPNDDTTIAYAIDGAGVFDHSQGHVVPDTSDINDVDIIRSILQN